jgi:hypothetical protein
VEKMARVRQGGEKNMQDVIGIKEIPLRVAIKFREGTQRNISGVNQANTTLETGSTAHITTETSH